ncbi:hypothetical protein FWF93_00920 [Candidatus Saccharibacteria bacterium]|nr:hypothetical protein [Candidatus Saccharibacteria bacterium]
MRTIIIYRETDDYYPDVRNWLADFSRRYPDKVIEEYSPDDVKIDDLIRVNELNKFPAIAALDNQNKVVARWTEDMLPKLADVAYYSEEKAERSDAEKFSANNKHEVIEPPTAADKPSVD